MKKILISCISFLCICIVLMSIFVVPAFALSDSPIGFTLANRYTSSPISSAQMHEIGFKGFTLPSTSSNVTTVGDRYFYGSADNYAVAQIRLQRQDSSALVDVGSYNITFEGVYYRNYDQVYEVAQVLYYVDYTDGTHSDYYSSVDTYIGHYDMSDPVGTIWRVSNLFEFEKPVKYIYIRIYWRLPEPIDDSSSYRIGYQSTNITIDKLTWFDKIISGISNSINRIFDTVTNIVPYITDFFRNFINTVINFIQSIVTGEIIEDLHTLISGSLLTLPDLLGFSDAISEYNTLESNILKIFEGYDNFVTDFYDEIDIGTDEMPFGIGKGLLVASACVTYISTEIPLVNELLYFGLAVGVVGFVLGSTWLVGRFIYTHKPEEKFDPSKYL